MMKVTDWKAVAEELADGLHARGSYKNQVIAKHTSEVPEGLATRLREALGRAEAEMIDSGANLPSLMVPEDATPEACTALDTDAKAMRVRQEVECSGVFWSLDHNPAGWWVALNTSYEKLSYRIDRYPTVDDAYRAAHEALRKAGKL